MGVLMGQLVIIDEDELNDLKYWAHSGKELTKQIDYAADIIYPHVNYWIDVGGSYEVAIAQLWALKQDAYKYNLPWWKRF